MILWFRIERLHYVVVHYCRRGLIGLIASAITKSGSMGLIANIFAKVLSVRLSDDLLGSWGPSLAGIAGHSNQWQD